MQDLWKTPDSVSQFVCHWNMTLGFTHTTKANFHGLKLCQTYLGKEEDWTALQILPRHKTVIKLDRLHSIDFNFVSTWGDRIKSAPEALQWSN